MEKAPLVGYSVIVGIKNREIGIAIEIEMSCRLDTKNLNVYHLSIPKRAIWIESRQW